ncbi:40S ribosomal protein S29-like, partial [Mesocricetus auratus]|uniref:40S ribosomal protein S29-like n=1 Tax=Mesocricetus auratus TaxID=10036 RepID=A0ABM2XP22_MESAU
TKLRGFTFNIILSWLLFPCWPSKGKKSHQQLYWSHPRKFCLGFCSCRVCSNHHGLIRKYQMNTCCQCFHQYEKDISFITLD